MVLCLGHRAKIMYLARPRRAYGAYGHRGAARRYTRACIHTRPTHARINIPARMNGAAERADERADRPDGPNGGEKSRRISLVPGLRDLTTTCLIFPRAPSKPLEYRWDRRGRIVRRCDEERPSAAVENETRMGEGGGLLSGEQERDTPGPHRTVRVYVSSRARTRGSGVRERRSWNVGQVEHVLARGESDAREYRSAPSLPFSPLSLALALRRPHLSACPFLLFASCLTDLPFLRVKIRKYESEVHTALACSLERRCDSCATSYMPSLFHLNIPFFPPYFFSFRNTRDQ